MKKPHVTGISESGWPIVDPDSVDWVGMANDMGWERPEEPVRIEDIPYVPADVDVGPDDGLRVWVDARPARIFIRGRGFASDKIVIEFDQPNPRFGDTFATKYFDIDEPGHLSWGHDADVMIVTFRADPVR